MKLATTTTGVSNNLAPPSRAREKSPDVNRWVAMLDAELRAEDTPTEMTPETIEVTFEFGRCTLDLNTEPLTAGASLRLDQRADEPLDVLADGRPIARGELVVIDGQLGVRIVELLLLLVAWFAFGIPNTFADERPRERTASTLFDNDPPNFLEVPFSSTRDRSHLAESDDVRPSTTHRSALKESISTPLTPRSTKPDSGETTPNRPGWSATVWPLLFVVGLIVVGARWLKSRSPDTPRGLPSEVFEVLGRKTIDPRTSVVVARCGSRLLILNLSPQGLSTLAEITDPVEIDCLAGLCRATQREQPLAETFRSLLQKPTGPKPASTAPSLEERLAARQTMASPTSPTHEARS
ncbi:MAG: flagellar biosynthetic protein FliO [Planctomycetaceae bacterium]